VIFVSHITHFMNSLPFAKIMIFFILPHKKICKGDDGYEIHMSFYEDMNLVRSLLLLIHQLTTRLYLLTCRNTSCLVVFLIFGVNQHVSWLHPAKLSFQPTPCFASSYATVCGPQDLQGDQTT